MYRKSLAGHCVLLILMAGVFAAGCEQQEISLESMEEAGASRSSAIGKPAPLFVLPDQNDQSWSLAAHKGKWVVLYFYPKDDTPGCICQATEFTELLFRFQNMNASVVGINADSPATHSYFADKHDLRLTLLSDTDHKVMKEYGVSVNRPFGGRAILRQTFIVDPDGIIRYHFSEVIPRGHADRVRQKLAELQQQRG